MRARRVRRYDKKRECYVYDIAFKTEVPLTERTVKVSEAFGLGLDSEQRHVLFDDFELRLREGDVVYITGDSGSGKSVLLNALREDLGDRAVSMDELPEPVDVPVIDSIGEGFSEALELLSRVGLNDAYLFLRRFSELSMGQRYRYRLAQMLASGKPFWLCDEFCSILDRTTAKIVAFNVQKQARRVGATLVVATSHTDLVGDLNPDLRVVKGWGMDVLVSRDEPRTGHLCSVSEEVVVEDGGKEDYDKLSYLHYRDSRVIAPYRFYKATYSREVVGVIVYTYSGRYAQGRKKAVGYQPTLEELNRDWTQVNRVIVHPKYRGIGLGSRIIRETLPLQGRKHVELTAVMARYNPFAEKAGMRLIKKTEPNKYVLKSIEALREIGFHSSRISSKQYNLERLKVIEDVEPVLDALANVSGVTTIRRLTRTSGFITKKSMFKAWLGNQSLESLAWVIKNLSILGQSKAYLYWCREGLKCFK
ncbi:MAG: ABC transporter ATP-binding protein [Candidatus Bathyarchaeota archaeon]|nr:ABC transporter ATP-binding protein [Candidatus Bathyarchaeota archaeon]